MLGSNAESRAINYLQSATMDENRNITVQGPGGFRVIVPPSCPPDPATPNAGSSPVVDGIFEPLSSRDFNGEYIPIFRGRIVFGPQPKKFFASILVFVVLLVLISIQSSDVVRELGNGTMAFGFLLHLFSLVAFLTIGLNDPGVIPENYRLRELIWDTEGYRRRNPGARFYRYCDACRGFRPPKSRHCEICDICIRDHETHLIVGGTCVGQRTTRSLIALSLTAGLLTLFIIIVNSIIIHRDSERAPPIMPGWRKGVAITSLVLGIILLAVPQLGIIVFLFRLFFVTFGYTGSSFIHRNYFYLTCPVDQRSVLKNYVAFFFGKRVPSIFRKKARQVEPEAGTGGGEEHANEDWISLLSLPPPHGLILLQELFRLRDEQNLVAQTEQSQRRRANFLQNRELNNNNLNNASQLMQENLLMSQVAAAARPKTIPSDPQLYRGELDVIPFERLRQGLKSGLCSTLSQRLKDVEQRKARNKSPRNAESEAGRRRSRTSPRLKSSSLPPPLLEPKPITLSEGSLPLSLETGVVVSTARAEQFRRLIQLILTRDREGLVEMGRTVNIPAMLGVQHFDPDNYQFIELSNGLPMVAPRRPQQGGLPHNRLGNLLGIPSMVAAGHLPPAITLAREMERLIGAGSIRRTSNLGTNRFIYEVIRRNRYPRRPPFPARGYRPYLGTPNSPNYPLLGTNTALLALLGRSNNNNAAEQLNPYYYYARDRDNNNRRTR